MHLMEQKWYSGTAGRKASAGPVGKKENLMAKVDPARGGPSKSPPLAKAAGFSDTPEFERPHSSSYFGESPREPMKISFVEEPARQDNRWDREPVGAGKATPSEVYLG